MSSTVLKGVIHGKSIELTEESGLPEGQEVSVEIRPIIVKKTRAEPPAPWWLTRLEVNPAIRLGKFVVKGTHLLADELVDRLQEGWGDDKVLQTHPELLPEDVAAL